MEQEIIPPAPKAEGDPRLKAAEHALGKYLAQFMGAPITEGLIKMVKDGLAEFRTTAMLRGIKLPKMVVVALPRAGYIQVWPKDLSELELKIRIKNLISVLQSERRNCDPEELAKAVRRAYPDYSPSVSSIKFN